ncbi:hypothetical protein OXX59_005831 [Metschnikowia pulcherrima]
MSESVGYLTVYNAHNGDSAKIPKPVRFLSMQKLKTHLSESFTDGVIESIDNIFLLTPFGIKLDFSMINEMSELYLYDRRLFQNSDENGLISRYLRQAEKMPFSSMKPEIFLGFQHAHFSSSDKKGFSGIKEMSTALKAYAKWTDSMATYVRQISDQIDAQIRQINAIFKALNIVFSFASNFVSSAEKTFKSQFSYVKMLAMKSLHKSWQSHFDSLEHFPAVKLMNGKTVHICKLLDRDSLSSAANYVSEHLPGVISQFNDLSSTMNKVKDDKLEVDAFIEQHRRKSVEKFTNFETERETVRNEIETMIAEVLSDMSALDTAPSKELQKCCEKHANICNQIHQKAVAMYAYMQSFLEFKATLAQRSPEIFEKIAVQQMKCVEVRNACKQLLSENEKNAELGIFSRIKENEDLLAATVDLPLLFGFVMVEKRRQFEWIDFYSKGIVTNMSEQLTVIIEHEKVFQKLWIKKFGKFIRLINPETQMHAHVPAIDVTLVNPKPAVARESVLCWLDDGHIEREDILSYISCVRQHKFVNSARFGDLLERNFKDLVASTEKLKIITKTVASLASISSADMKSQIISRENDQDVDEDADLKMIKGLKSRINKLEDLLHQQQFKNLTGWPVTKATSGQSQDNRASLLLNNTVKVDTSRSSIQFLPKVNSRRMIQDPAESSSRKVLDASTTIDKHLDNIRLRKEIDELKNSNTKLTSEKDNLSAELAKSREEMRSARSHSESLKSKLEGKLIDADQKLTENNSQHENQMLSLKEAHETALSDLQSQLANAEEKLARKSSENESLKARTSDLEAKLELQSSQTSRDNDSLRDEISNLTAKLSDLQIMNTELLSNMQAKESEFSKERSDTENKVKSLEFQLEEKTEDFEDLMEMTQSKSRSIEDLLVKTNKSIHALLNTTCALLKSNLGYFHEFCVVLESMGLLLVREINSETGVSEFRIRRVKGLRSKKDVEDSRPQLERTKSTAAQEVTKGFEWISEFEESQRIVLGTNSAADVTTTSNEEGAHDADAFEAETRQLIANCESYVLDKTNSPSKVSEFLKIISFEENVQLQAHDDGRDTSNEKFFSNGIIKRFNDVEGFAKRLTKENKAKMAELSKLSKHSNTKISVRDFQEGDLVLFLPTRIERIGDDYESKNTITPWTAFNIDAPHYFLDRRTQDSITGEEWIVSRITGITQYTVTEETAQDEEANPYSLSVGITWYMITTA